MFHLNKKCFLTLITVILGAFVQAYVIKVFIQPANLLSSGFTGVAILIEKITSTYFHFSFSTSLGMIVLNVPVAILCYKSISPRFTFFSLLEVFLASFFLKIIHFPPIFDDTLLNVIFGGTLYGLMTASILKIVFMIRFIRDPLDALLIRAVVLDFFDLVLYADTNVSAM